MDRCRPHAFDCFNIPSPQAANGLPKPYVLAQVLYFEVDAFGSTLRSTSGPSPRFVDTCQVRDTHSFPHLGMAMGHETVTAS